LKTRQTKSHKSASAPFWLKIQGNRVKAGADLPLRETSLVVIVVAAGSPLVAEILKVITTPR
jgi:hypothetical protein